MAQPNRSKPGSKDKHLASINFPNDLLEYLDDLAKELDVNRSSLVCTILKDFQQSGKTIRIEIVVQKSTGAVAKIDRISDKRINQTLAKRKELVDRNDKIVEMHKDGLLVKDIAKLVDLHETTVYNIIRRLSDVK